MWTLDVRRAVGRWEMAGRARRDWRMAGVEGWGVSAA